MLATSSQISAARAAISTISASMVVLLLSSFVVFDDSRMRRCWSPVESQYANQIEDQFP
jgi:hypothetical protein